MSTIVSQTISNGTVSTSTANVVQGCAKSWVNFNSTGGTITVRASYNVSSVTRSAAGAYVVNMTNALADANYSVVGSASNTGSQNSVIFNAFSNNTNSSVAPTTSSFSVATVVALTAFVDTTYICVAVFD
jgi:hypothetical protein